MIGLRKVVKLRIEDIPDKRLKLDKEGSSKKTFHYTWRNRYYIGNYELFKSRVFNDTDKKPLFARECDDEYLQNLAQVFMERKKDLEEKIDTTVGIMYFKDNGSKLYYVGNKKEDLKQKILKKTK